MLCHHDHVAFSRSFRRAFRKNERPKFPGTRRISGSGSAGPRRKRKGNGRRGDEKKRVPRNSAPYARWHFQTTTRGTSRGTPPPSLTSLGCSRGEIQIYAPTAPGVFFELMKNESGRAALPLSPPLLSPPPAISPFLLFARSFSQLPSLRHPAATPRHGSLLPVVSKS